MESSGPPRRPPPALPAPDGNPADSPPPIGEAVEATEQEAQEDDSFGYGYRFI